MKRIHWEAEATTLSKEVDLDRFVYRNETVDRFLTSDEGFKPFVIAGKGMGKTLLLHYRRQICEEKYNATFLPASRRVVDFPETIILEIKEEIERKLQNFDFCKRFWSFALKLYVFSGLRISSYEILATLRANESGKFSNFFNKVLDGEPKSISFIVNELLRLSVNQLSLAIDSVAIEIQPQFDEIHTSVFAFLDQLDQAFADNHGPIWVTMQNGLLDAAWDIGRINKHIKVFLSIRKEAYTFFFNQSANANAIQSSVVQIEYSKEHLKEMLNHLVQYYEGKADLYDFLGIKTFNNATTSDEEDVFDFMYRYSVGRPRDFVQMCYGISCLDRTCKRDEKKRSICRTAGEKIISGLHREQRILLECLKTEDRFKDFLKALKKNVYSKDEVIAICRGFNAKDCLGECETCTNVHHAFCDLFNMGLVGIIDKEGDFDEQLFKTPYESAKKRLPDSDYYLIHPALREYINQISGKYRLVNGILVGHQVLWQQEYEDYYKYDCILNKINNREIKKKYEKCLKTLIKRKKGKSKAEIVYPELEGLNDYQKKLANALNGYLREGTISMPKIDIFISYTSGGDEEVDSLVNSLRAQLRESGYNAEHYKSLVHAERDLDMLMKEHVSRSDKVIVVLSEAYKNKADNGEGGVWREYQMIRNEIETNPKKYILVCLGEFNRDTMYPMDLGNKWVIQNIRRRKEFNTLISFINDISEYSSEISDNVVQVEKVKNKPFFID